eukprot:13329177-Heterocapsa_arctica.AAC.1
MGGVGAHTAIADRRSGMWWGGCVVVLVPGAMVTVVLGVGSSRLSLPSFFTNGYSGILNHSVLG